MRKIKSWKTFQYSYITWKDFKKNSDYFDGELSKVFFKYKNKKEEKQFGVSDINQFGVDGTYFCTTDNCLSHYMENPGYNGEEYFDLKDDAIIAISEDEFLLDNKKVRKEIMSKADGFYCPPYDTYGIIIWGKNKLL